MNGEHPDEATITVLRSYFDQRGAEYVDLRGLAKHLGLTYGTIRQYRYEGRLPKPDARVGRTPLWAITTLGPAQ